MRPTERHRLSPWLGLAAALLLVAVAVLVPLLTGWHVRALGRAPLRAHLDPRVGPGTLPALLLAALALLGAGRLAQRLPWRLLLVAAFVVGVAWMLSLATIDGRTGIGHQMLSHFEYLRTARRVDDIGATVQEFVSRVSRYSPGHWPAHVSGHPPGALLFFVLLVRLGLGGWFATGMVITVVAATIPVAVAVTLRTLGEEQAARRVLPIVVFAPAALWLSVSADAVFAAVLAWAVALLAMAATRRSIVLSVLAGLLFGACLMLSFGLAVAAFLPLAVVLAARSWFPIPWATAVVLAVLVGFALAGFNWLEGLSAVHGRYYEGVAAARPAAYWVWADLAALVSRQDPPSAPGWGLRWPG